jgi:hypothetical protein
VSVGCTEDLVTGDLGRDQLADDVSIGESDDEAVLRGVVLVLRLGDQTLAGIVVGLQAGQLSVEGGVEDDQTLPDLLRLYLVWKREK